MNLSTPRGFKKITAERAVSFGGRKTKILVVLELCTAPVR